MPEKLGQRIRARRIELDMMQTELADAAGVKNHTMWRYEAGRSRPSAEVLDKIAEALGTTSKALLRGEAADEEEVPAGREMSVGEAALFLFASKVGVSDDELAMLRERVREQVQFYEGSSGYAAILADLEEALSSIRSQRRGFAKTRAEGELVDTSKDYDGPRRKKRK